MKLTANVSDEEILLIEERVVDKFCRTKNEGHARGKNNPQYLKNYEYHHKRYQRALKALEVLDNYLQY